MKKTRRAKEKAVKEPRAPEAVAIEVVAVRATEADESILVLFDAPVAEPARAVYVVRIQLESIPAATSMGWALYVGDLRIPKYWAYAKGIYFKVFDPQFFEDHKGGRLRFSRNGTDFLNTDLKLPAPRSREKKSERSTQDLPLQSDVLR